MKKLLSVGTLVGFGILGVTSKAFAQGDGVEPNAQEITSLHQSVLDTFIDGGPFFMSFVLICLILGLALCIERIIYLNMATTNTRKLLDKIGAALDEGGLDAAKEVTRNTSGPVASIFYQALDRSHGNIDQVEKVIAYGGVQMGLLEKGLSWISLFIALAPMLGFHGYSNRYDWCLRCHSKSK